MSRFSSRGGKPELDFWGVSILFLIFVSLFAIGFLDCELGIYDFSIDLGIFSRYPDSIENTTLDDYLVLGTNRINAKNILDSGRENFGFISVDGKKSWAQWLYRFQGMWQHLRISALEKPGLLGQFFWALSIYLAANKPFSNQDNWILSHLMILTKERRKYSTWLTDKAVQYWNNKKGIVQTSSIVSDYLGPDCQDHPLIEAWKKYDV